MKCPFCGSVDVRRSPSQGAEKVPRYLFARKYYRCMDCDCRFAQNSFILKEDKKIVWTWGIVIAGAALVVMLATRIIR